MNHTIHLGVRSLCEFLLRSGSIDNRFGGTDRANEGSRIHRQLQKSGGAQYHSEVFLRLEILHDETAYTIDGRVDGVIEEEALCVVDEIKTTAYPLALILEDFNRAHWGQAMCYAYMLARRSSLSNVAVQLRYFQIDTQEIKTFRRFCSFEELETFFLSLLNQYGIWANWQNTWMEIRDTSIRALAFPFDTYRAGQRRLAAAVYRTVKQRGRLFVQAPTGIGKTISTLFPAIKAMGEGMAEKIFYLTAKSTTRQAAQDTLARLRIRGARLKAVTLTAKDKICPLETRDCNPDSCPYANGYYDRANDALFALLQREDGLTRETIETHALEWRVCPFELSLDLTLWSDAVIGDYNYLFDPVVSLKRFFADAGGEYIFLVDEAHNLPDRAREMYSTQINKKSFLTLRKCVSSYKPLARALSKANSVFLKLRHDCEEAQTNTGEDMLLYEKIPVEPCEAIAHFAAVCGEWLQEQHDSPLRPNVLELYFQVRFFLRIRELFDSRFVACAFSKGSDAVLRLICLDPSALLDACMTRGRSAILFSATLSPPGYYAAVLGGGETAKALMLPSPFDSEHLCLLAADQIGMRFTQREQSIPLITTLLREFIKHNSGNYLFFFPSYHFMSAVYEAFCEDAPHVHTVLQVPGTTEEEREAFLTLFDSENPETLVGFCVLGGVYAEGIDLLGNRLIGAAVIGVGMPQVNAQQNILRDYFERTCGKGFDFAYRYPGFNKVLQATGRVIRSEGDRGAVLLIDSRFTLPAYRCLYPKHWNRLQTVHSVDELAKCLQHFWG